MKNMKYVLTIIFAMVALFSMGQNDSATIADHILGDMPINYFWAMLLFSVVGAATNMISDVTRRDKPSNHSPKKFSISYWWEDNWRKTSATLILMPVALLTCSDMFGLELTKLNAFVIGFTADHLVEIAKRKKLGLVKGAGIPVDNGDENETTG